MNAPCYAPGDLIVSQVLSGFVLGRVVQKPGSAPRWSFVASAGDYDDAVEQARTIALAKGAHAWLQRRGEDYAPL